MNSTNSYLDKRNKLILENQGLIWKMLRRYLSNPTQDDFNTAVCVFMKYYPRYNNRYKISSFIFGVVRPETLRIIFRNANTVTYSYYFLEKKKNRETIQRAGNIIDERDVDSNPTSNEQEHIIDTKIDMCNIDKVIDKYLDDSEKSLLYRHYIEGKSNPEIAKELKLKAARVWYMVTIAKTKVQYVIRMIEKIANTEDKNERQKLKSYLRRMLLLRNKDTNNLRGGLPNPKQAEAQVGCKF